MRARPHGVAAAALWLLLAGCATRPASVAPAPAAAPPRTAAESARDGYEAALQGRAAAATAERRWHDAALAWELLALLRPDDPRVAERLADARAHRQAALAELVARAEQADRRESAEVAAQRWWAVLALDPSHAAAAAALRQLESERTRRLYLGRHAGAPAARHAVARADAASAPLASAANRDPVTRR